MDIPLAIKSLYWWNLEKSLKLSSDFFAMYSVWEPNIEFSVTTLLTVEWSWMMLLLIIEFSMTAFLLIETCGPITEFLITTSCAMKQGGTMVEFSKTRLLAIVAAFFCTIG